MSVSKVPTGARSRAAAERVQTVEAVRPAADDDGLIKPRVEGFDQPGEILDIGWGRPLRFSPRRSVQARDGGSPRPGLAAGRMGTHVEPDLHDVGNRNAVAGDCGAED